MLNIVTFTTNHLIIRIECYTWNTLCSAD